MVVGGWWVATRRANESQWQQVMSALFVLDRDTERDSKESADAEWQKDTENQNEVGVEDASMPQASASSASSASSSAAPGPSFFLPYVCALLLHCSDVLRLALRCAVLCAELWTCRGLGTRRSRPLYWTGYSHAIEMHDPVMARKAGGTVLLAEALCDAAHCANTEGRRCGDVGL
jgi:hypothetical protein